MLNATWPITKLLCHDVLLRHVQVHLIFKSRKHIAASANSVKYFETPAVVTTWCELINLYFTLTQGGLISIFFVSSLASAKKKTNHREKYALSCFVLMTIITWPLLQSHAITRTFDAISEESHAIMQTLHYVGKQKILCHVPLNTYQLKQVMKVFSSVSVASYDGNFSKAIAHILLHFSRTRYDKCIWFTYRSFPFERPCSLRIYLRDLTTIKVSILSSSWRLLKWKHRTSLYPSRVLKYNGNFYCHR